MGIITETLILILLSSVKYIVVIFALLAQSSRSWITDMLIVIIGGSIGVLVFTFCGAFISNFFKQFKFFKIKFKNRKRIISIKKGYGLLGITFLTPLILGIPLGSILGSLFENNKKRLLRLQLTSIILWSFVLFGLKGLIQFWI